VKANGAGGAILEHARKSAVTRPTRVMKFASAPPQVVSLPYRQIGGVMCHVSYSFLALVLNKELEERMADLDRNGS
jgi:hypothetical protein